MRITEFFVTIPCIRHSISDKIYISRQCGRLRKYSPFSFSQKAKFTILAAIFFLLDALWQNETRTTDLQKSASLLFIGCPLFGHFSQNQQKWIAGASFAS